ncbi:MAG: hypothetical protein Q8P16_00295, partial [bacterium]|nr:hypothetical protein [bacterium]
MKKYKAIAIQAAPLALVGGVALLGLLALSASPALAHSLEFRGNGNAFIKSIAAPLEVHVNGNGRVLVRGAEVVSVGSGGVITAENALGGSTLVWTIQTDEDTQFLSLAGETTSVGDISVGDLISFRGTIDETASNFTVNADIVKNWSDTKNIEVSGKVESVNTADGTFVLKVRG